MEEHHELDRNPIPQDKAAPPYGMSIVPPLGEAFHDYYEKGRMDGTVNTDAGGSEKCRGIIIW